MFNANEARNQSKASAQAKLQSKLQEFEQLIKQAAQNGKRKLVTDEIPCSSKDEYDFIKQVGHELVRHGYEVGMGTEVTSSHYIVRFDISW